jgi:Protein of unknown function (DUF938)
LPERSGNRRRPRQGESIKDKGQLAKFVIEFGKDTAPSADDGRLDAPAVHRNQVPIREVVMRVLGDCRGHAIEIGSGTGQHIIGLAQHLPNLTWWPSDPNAAHRNSIEAWRRREGPANVMPPVDLDAGQEDWRLGTPGRPPQTDIAAILCINVLHIAPCTVAQGLFRAAGRLLNQGGSLILYGPYAINGVHTAPSNARFDADLRAQDPQWGVRDINDVKALAASSHLMVSETVAMPANNLILIVTPDPLTNQTE